MRLEKILPRTLGESNSDCASILTSLIMAAHFERSRARALGWRGVRPSASEYPTWTCRVAGSEHIFGIRFDGEEKVPALSSPLLRGYFSLHVFPRTESPLLDTFPLEALQFALSPAYEQAIREFSGTEAEFRPFCLGRLFLEASFAGNELALTLEAPARHRIYAADGIPAEDGWLVAPGAPECDVPAFRLFLRFFSVLVCTAQQQLEETPLLFRSMTKQPSLCFHSNGTLEPCPGGEQETVLTFSAAFGFLPRLEGTALKSPQHLPARYQPPDPEQSARRPVLHVLTGFLGAGKTTFLRRWLDFLHGRERYTGVIQNEFGKVELDATLMKGDTVVEALDEGCVCCSLADSLRPGLERIIAAMPADQFVLETTGLANPINIMEALNGLRDIVVPGLVITVADAIDLHRVESTSPRIEDKGIRHEQLRKADVIILNKIDVLSSDELKALTARLRGLNPAALILPARYGAVPFAELDAWMDAHTEKRLPSRKPELALMTERAPTHSDEGYIARNLTFQGTISRSELEALLYNASPGLCRAKGILRLEDEGICVVQYAAGQLELSPAPGEKVTDLVLIGMGLEAEQGTNGTSAKHY